MKGNYKSEEKDRRTNTIMGNTSRRWWHHRYLMSRLSLQVFYLWRPVLSTAPPFIWWSNLEILFGPLHRSYPFIGELRCQAIQTEHGPYIAERTQKAVYIVRCLWVAFLTTVHQQEKGSTGTVSLEFWHAVLRKVEKAVCNAWSK
jgi:hypothetical protein